MTGDHSRAGSMYRMALLRPSGRIHEAVYNNMGWNQYMVNHTEHAEVAVEMIKESVANAEPHLRQVESMQSMQEEVIPSQYPS